MNAPHDSIWDVLEIAATQDEREIRRAYARKLKRIDARVSPSEFMALRRAFERAMEGSGARPSDTSLEFSSNELPGAPAEALESVEVTLGSLPATPSLAAVARMRIEQLVNAALAIAPDNVSACRQAIEAICLTDDSFELRQLLAATLADHLARRQFGMHSGAILLAACDVFDWRDPRRLTEAGEHSARISALLDELGLLSAAELRCYLLLCNAPSIELASRLWRLSPGFGKKTPILTQFFYGNDHLDRWHRFVAQPSNRAKVAFANWRSLAFVVAITGWRRFALSIGAIVAIAMAAVGVFNLALHSQQSRGASTCDTEIAFAISNSWRNLSVRNLAVIKNCADSARLPIRCRDRHALDGVLDIARRLQMYLGPVDTGSVEPLVFNLDDGRAIGFAASATCAQKWNVLQNMHWFAFDRATVEGMLVSMAGCAAPLQETLLTRLLPHVEGWGGAGRLSPSIPLQQFIGETKPPLALLLSRPVAYASQCFSTADELSQLERNPAQRDAVHISNIAKP